MAAFQIKTEDFFIDLVVSGTVKPRQFELIGADYTSKYTEKQARISTPNNFYTIQFLTLF